MNKPSSSSRRSNLDRMSLRDLEYVDAVAEVEALSRPLR
jgi:hypothetical protein